MAGGITDIANKAGVSIATVSAVINEKGRISPATRKKVLDVVRELAYDTKGRKPAERGLRTNTIGLVMPGVWSWAGGFYHRAVTAATQTAATFGYDCKILMLEEIQNRVIDNFHKGRNQLGCDHIVFFCPKEIIGPDSGYLYE